MKRRPLRGLYAPEMLESRIAPATFIVTTIVDSGVGSLRQAVLDANDHKGADTITFAASVNAPIVLTSQILVADTLTIKGSGVDKTIISGNDTTRIFEINDSATDQLHPTTITGLTLIDGKASANGGAIDSTESLTMSNVVVSSCTATDGGGVNVSTNGKVSLTHVSLIGNTASGSDGGGLDARVGQGIGINACLVIGNSAANSFGGGMALASFSVDGKTPGAISVTASTFVGNTGLVGGGLEFFGSAGAKVAISKSSFTANNAGSGGAFVLTAGTLNISGSVFSQNTSTNSGGAAFLEGGDSTPRNLTISGSVFAGNTAGIGGAIALARGDILTVKSSHFLGNSATTRAGAIDVTGIGTVLNLQTSILSGNKAANAGGAVAVTTSAKINIKGGTFSGNYSGGTGGAIYAGGSGKDAVDLTISGALIQGNVANSGGGVYADSSGAIVMSAVKVIGNRAKTADGGGMYLRSTGSLTITGALFTQNVAGDDGGGLFVRGTAIIKGSKFIDNSTFGTETTNLGGGIIFFDGTLTLSASTVMGNTAGQGGGIASYAGADDLMLTGSKITGNFARIDSNVHFE